MSSGRDEVELPFLFVGYDEPEPREWREAHPGWLKIPAVMVLRGGGDRGPYEPTTASAGQTSAFFSGRPEDQQDAAPFLQISQPAGRRRTTRGCHPPPVLRQCRPV